MPKCFLYNKHILEHTVNNIRGAYSLIEVLPQILVCFESDLYGIEALHKVFKNQLLII